MEVFKAILFIIFMWGVILGIIFLFGKLISDSNNMKHIEAKEFKNYIKFINSSNYEELLETSQNIKSRKTENNLHFKDFFVGIFVLVIGLGIIVGILFLIIKLIKFLWYI